jgi:hypothetical protein
MAIAVLSGAMVLQLVLDFQARVLTEIARNDLQDRAERLLRFMAGEIGAAAFVIGARPQMADGSALVLSHDSLAGDPLEALPGALLVEDHSDADDRLTVVRALSFTPPLRLALAAVAGEDWLALDRRPNHPPGSTRELQPAPEAISHLALFGQPGCYAVQLAEQTLRLTQPLATDAAAGSEVFGVRATSYFLEPHAGSGRLRRDDFTSRNILDDAVDGLQFEYLLADGSLVSAPLDPAAIRAVRINLLLRDLRADRSYRNETVYTLGNRSYGPYHDNFRRCQVSRLVEVKNHGL